MNKIKVYLKKPLVISDSPYYEYLTKDVSPKLDYVNTRDKRQGVIENVKKFKLLNKFKRITKLTIRTLFPGMPNAHLSKTNLDYDLIHCAHCLSLNEKPWVMDIEYVNQFWLGGIVRRQRKAISDLLKRRNCKKILAWTQWTKDGILKEFPEVKNKIEIVYPAIPSQKFDKKKSKEINILFASRRFYFKGGLHAVEVMDRLTKKYARVNAFVISDTPKEVLKKYSSNKKIHFMSVMPKEKLFSEIYPKIDVFIYPSYTDTFGFMILEALSFGIPVITVSGQSRGELVTDGKTGFVVNGPNRLDLKNLEGLIAYRRVVDELEEKAKLLIDNKKLRDKMSKNAFKEVSKGKFSLEERNKKLERIYSEALNR